MKKLYIAIIILLFLAVVSAVSLEVIRTQGLVRLQERQMPSGEIYNYTPHAPSYKLKLKAIQFIPEEMTSEQVASAIGKDNVYYLVQFKSYGLGEYALLGLYNIRELGYLPDDTYIMKIPNGTQPMLLYGSIRWIGIMQPEWKVSPTLKNYTNSLESNETVNISVQFFEPINEKQLNNIKNLTIGFKSDGMIFTIYPNNLIQIANLNFLKWITGEPKGHLI